MKEWLKAAGIRAGRTAAQVAILAIMYNAGITLVDGGFDVLSMDWIFVLSFAAGGAILSMLTSLAGIPEVEGGAGVLKLTNTTTKTNGAFSIVAGLPVVFNEDKNEWEAAPNEKVLAIAEEYGIDTNGKGLSVIIDQIKEKMAEK